VLVDTYVKDSDGTGIVHQAPAFGEDDHRIALAHGVIRPDEIPPCPIDDKGHFTDEVSDFAGLYVKVRWDLKSCLKSFILTRLCPGCRRAHSESAQSKR